MSAIIPIRIFMSIRIRLKNSLVEKKPPVGGLRLSIQETPMDSPLEPPAFRHGEV